MMRQQTCDWTMVAMAVLAMGVSTVYAHEMAHRGTVQAIEADRVQVQILDESGASGEVTWFTVADDTQVRRGDETVTFAAAALEVGERIVVIVDHDVDETAAIEVRVAAREQAR